VSYVEYECEEGYVFAEKKINFDEEYVTEFELGRVKSQQIFQKQNAGKVFRKGL